MKKISIILITLALVTAIVASSVIALNFEETPEQKIKAANIQLIEVQTVNTTQYIVNITMPIDNWFVNAKDQNITVAYHCVGPDPLLQYYYLDTIMSVPIAFECKFKYD